MGDGNAAQVLRRKLIKNDHYEKGSLIEIGMACTAYRRVCRLKMVQSHHHVLVVGVFAIVDACGVLGCSAYHRFRFRMDLQL